MYKPIMTFYLTVLSSAYTYISNVICDTMHANYTVPNGSNLYPLFDLNLSPVFYESSHEGQKGTLEK